MTKLTTFQVALFGFFGFIALFAVLIFAGIIPRPGSSSNVGGEVMLWGSIPDETIQYALQIFKDQNESSFTLKYVYKDPAVLENELIEALAADRGPDLVLMPHTSLVKRQANILPFPYDFYPQVQFSDDFVRESSLYLTGNGILALPMFVDPMVLYYNADILAAARMVSPPKTWKEMEVAVKALTQADANKNISLSAIALGKANNIQNAKDILSLLIMQAGNPITALDTNGKLSIILSSDGSNSKNSAIDALTFFNHFSDSTNALYSWNAAQPEARETFLRGRLAMYLGYSTEYNSIKRQNPQLGLEITAVSQLSKNSAVTVGRLFGVSLVRGSKNPETAALAAKALSGQSAVKLFSEEAGLAPARKDLLGSFPKDPVQSAFYQSAIFSRGWLDPNPVESQKIFQKMIENSQSGVLSVSDAIRQGEEQLRALITQS